MNDQLIIGMLSGTSRDGVDAVLANFSQGSMDILHATCTPYPAAIKMTLEQLLESGKRPLEGVVGLLDENLGRFFARTAQNLVREAGMEMRDIHAIGSHGQNVWHQPSGENPVSLQLGKGALIAKNTSTTVVNNFRTADVLAGGQGAPLAPLLHQHLFRCKQEDRVVLNIGGISNLTMLPAEGEISGFDSGPGNCLLDAWTKLHLHKDYDHNGDWASKGQPDKNLLKHMLSDPYFSLAAPKSTGLEYFNMNWLKNFPVHAATEPGVVQSTLAELTVMSIANSLKAHTSPMRLLVCGGGTHNAYLMHRLTTALPNVVVESTARHGANPDFVEGLLFAWLAHERLKGSVQDTRLITGATRPVLLGDIHQV